MKRQKVRTKYIYTGLLALLILAAALVFRTTSAQDSQVIGTVSVALETPLTLELSSRSSVFIGQKFSVKAELNNIGHNDVTGVTLSLELPVGLDLIRGDLNQDIGTVKAGKKEIINWVVRGSELGSYVVQVHASGIEENSNEEVEALASHAIKVRQKRLFDSLIQSVSSFFRFLFRL